MSNWLQLAVGLATAYLATTLSESCLHRTVGHASPRLRRFWLRHPRLCGHLIRAHYRHAIVHHGLTFTRDHVTQFVDAADKARVDSIVAARCDWLIEKEHYGLTVGLRGLLTYNMSVVPIFPVLFWLCGSVACLGAFPVLLAAPLLSMLVHPYLHLPHTEAVHRSSRPVAFLLRTRYFRAVARHHYLHHVYQCCNFNLLLSGDRLLGTHRRASPADLRAMEQIGISID
jgi:hypothetical protein